MKTPRLLGCALTLLALSAPVVSTAPAAGQNATMTRAAPRKPVLPFDGLPLNQNFPLLSFIDSPDTSQYNVYGPGFTIAGWALDCRNGQQPPFVAILHGDFDGTREWTYITSYTVHRGLPRPDVQAHPVVQATCPGVSANTGFHVLPEITLTPGRHTFSVMWSAGDGPSRSTTVWVRVP